MNFLQAFVEVMDEALSGELPGDGVKQGDRIGMGDVRAAPCEPLLGGADNLAGGRLSENAVLHKPVHQGR
jgi:hypothetical protein